MKTSVTLLLTFTLASAFARPLQLASQIDPSVSPPDSASGDSFVPVVSADGRFVVFSSTADNLALTASNTPFHPAFLLEYNVYLRDRASNTTILVSASLNGLDVGDGSCFADGISTNNQFVLFEGDAENLVATDTNMASDVFLRDVISGTTTLVSVNTNGVAGNKNSYGAVMTPDGRYVAFTSDASDLVANDTNGIADVFVRDLQSGTTVCASPGAISTGSFTLASHSDAQAITPDGRYVAFYSSATNLITGGRLAGEVYVRDMVAGTTLWASSDARTLFKTVAGSTNAVSCNPRLSDDGNYVGFAVCTNSLTAAAPRAIVLRYDRSTGLTDLVHTNAYLVSPSFEEASSVQMTPDGRFIAFVANVTGASGTNTAIYRWDAQSGVTTLVSENLANTLPPPATCDSPAISDDGNFVAFISDAVGLTTNNISTNTHVYLRDIQAGTTYLLDVDTNGAGAGVDSLTIPAISADGMNVAFESGQGNLAMNDSNRGSDIFLHGTNDVPTELISVRNPALPCRTPNGYMSPSVQTISADGRYVIFASQADNVAASDTNEWRDVFVRDLFTGSNSIVSVGVSGVPGNGASYEPAISGDGRYVVFSSTATNLGANDTNNASDVFVRDLQSHTTSFISVNSTGSGIGSKDSYSPMISMDGRFVLFLSKANNLVSGAFTGTDNLFLRDRQSGVTYALTTAGHVCSAMSFDGHFIAFTDTAGSSAGRIYVWDSLLARRVATNSTVPTITKMAISPDGNRVAYHAGSGSVSLRVWNRALSQDSVIMAGTPVSSPGLRFSADSRWLVHSMMSSGVSQVYLYDFGAQTSRLVSHVSGLPTTAASGSSDSPDINADGRFVIYRSSATNIVAGDANEVPDIFLYDTLTGGNTLLSASSWSSGSANNRSYMPSFSTDGRMLVFCSWASDLVAGDFNRNSDLFGLGLLYADLGADGGKPKLSWPANPGENYAVEYKDDLSDYAWHPLSGTVIVTGNKAELTDETLSSGRRFYRIMATE